jgi:hypothetical protein
MCCEESSARPWVSWTRLQDAVAGPTGVLVRPVTAQEMRPRIFDSAASVGQGGGRWRGGSRSCGHRNVSSARWCRGRGSRRPAVQH